MVDRIVQPSSDRPAVNEDGSPSTQVNSWFREITNQAVIVGTGSPEGVIEAPQASSYMDDAGVAGAICYIKRDADVSGDKTMGWVLI